VKSRAFLDVGDPEVLGKRSDRNMKSDPTFPLPAAGPIVLIVRHADIEIPRTTKDPPITPRGKLRAEELLKIAAVFASSGTSIRALYATEAKRTQQTLEPLSLATGVAVTVIESSDAFTLEREILRHHAGNIVMAGHSNTVPLTIEALRGPGGITIRENEFDRLFALGSPGSSQIQFAELRYGPY
jgi:phosphohistidine phosphatase SixA